VLILYYQLVLLVVNTLGITLLSTSS